MLPHSPAPMMSPGVNLWNWAVRIGDGASQVNSGFGCSPADHTFTHPSGSAKDPNPRRPYEATTILGECDRVVTSVTGRPPQDSRSENSRANWSFSSPVCSAREPFPCLPSTRSISLHVLSGSLSKRMRRYSPSCSSSVISSTGWGLGDGSKSIAPAPLGVPASAWAVPRLRMDARLGILPRTLGATEARRSSASGIRTTGSNLTEHKFDWRLAASDCTQGSSSASSTSSAPSAREGSTWMSWSCTSGTVGNTTTGSNFTADRLGGRRAASERTTGSSDGLASA
mmetsp:Transcript_35020/g.91671  ORF Transcript_35020/g.91671 Transcript_35020/m.91671 type:complete len:284 (-) Transcript_35020:196-1047(-)